MNATTGEAVEILLIEDNPGDVRLTMEALKEGKIINHLTVAGTGEDGLSVLRREGPFGDATRPDLILLDLNLPGKSGGEVLAEIKTDESLRRIPVVILTTSKADQDIFSSYDHHANCYITKPAQLEEFIGVVKSIEQFWLSVVKLPPQ